MAALDGEPNGLDTGCVLCEELTVRDRPGSSGTASATLPYGEEISILRQDGAWMQIITRMPDAESLTYMQGWVRGEYVLINPQRYTPEGDTAVCAMQAEGSPRVGLISSGRYMVIGEMNGYTVISLRGASGFIKK